MGALKTLLAAGLAAMALSSGAWAQDGGKPAASVPAQTAKAIFAGGCFWCMEGPFDKIDGVVSTTSGYIGGRVVNPTYQQVSYEDTGHAEAVEIVYDPAKVSYDKLLDVFWHNVDPFVQNRQFCDVGHQYRTAIFAVDASQRSAAEASLKKVQARFPKQKVYTEINDAAPFYKAEEYHQDFYIKNPSKYKFYRWNCGRDQRLKDIWGTEAGH